MTQLKRFNMGPQGESDCPVFDGMYEYFAVSCIFISNFASATRLYETESGYRKPCSCRLAV